MKRCFHRSLMFFSIVFHWCHIDCYHNLAKTLYYIVSLFKTGNNHRQPFKHWTCFIQETQLVELVVLQDKLIYAVTQASRVWSLGCSEDFPSSAGADSLQRPHTNTEFTLMPPWWFWRSSTCNSQRVLVENKFTCLVIQSARAFVCCSCRTGRLSIELALFSDCWRITSSSGVYWYRSLLKTSVTTLKLDHNITYCLVIWNNQ